MPSIEQLRLSYYLELMRPMSEIIDQKPFPFFSLPPELRLEIIHHAVRHAEIVPAATRLPTADWAGLWRTNEPPLAITCKELRQDTLRAYYRNNTFEIRDAEGFAHGQLVDAWLNSLGPRICAHFAWAGGRCNKDGIARCVARGREVAGDSEDVEIFSLDPLSLWPPADGPRKVSEELGDLYFVI